MSQQQEDTKAKSLCRMGCGFFGNEATGNCCSKCWMESLKRDTTATPVPDRPKATTVVEDVVPMDICSPVQTTTPVPQNTSPAAAPVKRKKKKSYKSLMAGMMTGQAPKNVQREREALSKGLGGGAFTKVEKI